MTPTYYHCPDLSEKRHIKEKHAKGARGWLCEHGQAARATDAAEMSGIRRCAFCRAAATTAAGSRTAVSTLVRLSPLAKPIKGKPIKGLKDTHLLSLPRLVRKKAHKGKVCKGCPWLVVRTRASCPCHRCSGYVRHKEVCILPGSSSHGSGQPNRREHAGSGFPLWLGDHGAG